MTFVTLDTIINGMLISRGYPIHYYMQFLYWGSRAYEELNYDSLGNIKTMKIPVNSYGAISVPCDFVDWVRVGRGSGQYVRPLSPRAGLASLNNFDDDGTKIRYESPFPDASYLEGVYNGYGYGSEGNSNTFKFIPARQEIQLHGSGGEADIILEYISDGSCIDNATRITPYAKTAIEAYVMWKMKSESRSYGLGEREEARKQWHLEHARFRARRNGLTKEKIFSTLRRHTHSGIKG